MLSKNSVTKWWFIIPFVLAWVGCANPSGDAPPNTQTVLSASATNKATAQEAADFWDQVFNGAAPYGVPPLNASRTNQRVVGNVTLWDVAFDSYRDPDTDQPVRLRGFYGIPNNISSPGPGNTFPGLVVTHSVGVTTPAEGEEMAIFFAQRGYAALTFYIRNYGTSTMVSLNANAPDCSNGFCANLADDGERPLDTIWTGVPVDVYQAGEFLAAQPEVWNPDNLAFIGHSFGGYAALMAGIFSTRFSVIAASAPAATSPDLDAWMNFWNPSRWWDWANSQPDPAQAMALLTRMWSFTGAYSAINNPAMVAKNPNWKLENAEIWLYGGQMDPAVPPGDVEAAYLLLDNSNNKAFYWSPTGGHGGPESWDRAQAWLAGHYPGVSQTPPTADLQIISLLGQTVTLTGAASVDDSLMVSWEYDFGDGTTKFWGDTVSYTYANDGVYDVTLTVTDGAGLRDTAAVQVVIGSGEPALWVTAADPVIVPEGDSSAFTVALTNRPGTDVAVTVAFNSGDADLSVQNGNLTFSPATWSDAQTVTLTAAQDDDAVTDTAVFTVSAPGMPSVNVNAVSLDDERSETYLPLVDSDDEAPSFVISAGTASGQPGQTVSIPVTLSNPSLTPVTALAMTMGFDDAILIGPAAVKGPAIPGSAWWTFSASSTPGVLAIMAQEFVPPPDPAINGVIATLSFTIDGTAAPGVYPVEVTGGAVNGAVAPPTQAGSITVNPAAAAHASLATEGTITMDAGVTYQTMAGFGASQRLFADPHVIGGRDTNYNLNEGLQMTAAQQNGILNRLYVDLGLTRVRAAVYPAEFEPINDNDDPAVTDLTRFNFEGKRNDGFFEYVDTAVDRGLTTWWLSPGSLETWMSEANPEEYVEWAMASIRRWRDNGLELPYYSIMNEPGYQRGGYWSGEYLRDVVKLLGAQLRAEGFNTQIVIPDDLNATQAYQRSQIILADPEARQYVGALTFHLYDEPIHNAVKMRELSEQYGIPLWMSEYSQSGPLAWANTMHTLIADYNVSAIDYMWGFVGSTGDATLIKLRHDGQQYLGYDLKKQYFVMGQFSRFIRPGSQRVAADSSDPSLKVTAYQDGGNFVLVVINNANAPKRIQFILNGIDNAAQVQPIRTSASEDWAVLDALPVIDAQFSAVLPAKSITTFVAGEFSASGN